MEENGQKCETRQAEDGSQYAARAGHDPYGFRISGATEHPNPPSDVIRIGMTGPRIAVRTETAATGQGNFDNRMVDRVRVVAYEFADGELIGSALGKLPWGDGEFALVLCRGESTFVAVGDLALAKGDLVWCLRPSKGTFELEQHASVTEYPLKKIRTDGIEDQREPSA